MLRWLRSLLGAPGGSEDLGRLGEEVAARHLLRHRFQILAKNLRAGRGEVDLVASDGSTLVFVEVKSRSGLAERERTGLEGLDRRKRAALRRTCALLRKRYWSAAERYRLDVVTVDFGADRQVTEVRWYPAVLELD